VTFACALGDAAALQAFEATYVPEVERAVARVDSRPAFVADAVQTVRERLLVRRADKPPRILEYGGRASLRAWVAAVALRVALGQRRGRAAGPYAELESGTGAPNAGSPELDVLRARYKEEFDGSLRTALADLGPRERSLLRLHLVERMSIDALATSYGVSRATAARWLAGARQAVFERTRNAFCEKTKVSASEFESIAAILKDDLEVSLATQLGT
jgi:RNA polymerase sigma-70 factor (ECF subfamily)